MPNRHICFACFALLMDVLRYGAISDARISEERRIMKKYAIDCNPTIRKLETCAITFRGQNLPNYGLLHGMHCTVLPYTVLPCFKFDLTWIVDPSICSVSFSTVSLFFFSHPFCKRRHITNDFSNGLQNEKKSFNLSNFSVLYRKRLE